MPIKVFSLTDNPRPVGWGGAIDIETYELPGSQNKFLTFEEARQAAITQCLVLINNTKEQLYRANHHLEMLLNMKESDVRDLDKEPQK